MSEYKRCNKCGKTFYADMDWKRICLDCWLKAKNKEKERESSYTYRPTKEPIIKDNGEKLIMIKKMIFLCHPDKHNGSATSHEVTKFLIKTREELIKK